MKTRVQKWGNSLALRIPRAFAEELGLEKNSPVELHLEKGKLVLAHTPEPEPSLDELLAGVTRQNLHREAETGPPMGDEAW